MSKQDAHTARTARARSTKPPTPPERTLEPTPDDAEAARVVTDAALREVVGLALEVPRLPELPPVKVPGHDFDYIATDDARRIIEGAWIRQCHSRALCNCSDDVEAACRESVAAPLDAPDRPGPLDYVAGLAERLDDLAARYAALTGDATPATVLRIAQEIPHLIGAVRDLLGRTARAEQQAAELQADLTESIERAELAAAQAAGETAPLADVDRCSPHVAAVEAENAENRQEQG